jgi:hypothetical protein
VKGISPLAGPGVVQEALSLARAKLAPGNDPEHFAWANRTVHRNLYEISLP